MSYAERTPADSVINAALRRRLSRRLRLAAACAAALLLPTAARAQSPAALSQAQGTAQPPAVIAGWDDGFFLQSSGGDYRLVFGLVAQADGRFALGEPSPITNTFTLRKLRPTFTGRLTRYFEFKVMPDLGSGTTVVQDAYIELRVSPALRIRTGKDKTPIGYELMQGDGNLWFPERSLGSSLVPNRDLGVQVLGDIERARLSYGAGVFNGVPDGTSTSSELDSNGAKDLAGRVVVQPFRRTGAPASGLRGFGFHLGGSFGRQAGTLPSFKTSIGQTYFSYRSDAAAAGDRTRISPAVFYYYKSVGTFAEWMRSTERVARGTSAADIRNRGWQISGSWFPTGEAASYGTIRPKHDFAPPQHHYGAVQVLARFSELRVDSRAFDNELATPASSSSAKALEMEVNWYPNPFIKYYAAFERSVFGTTAGSHRSPERAVVVRAQVAF